MIIRRSNDRSRDIDLGPVAPYSPRSYGGASGAVTIGDMKPVLNSNGGNFITANSGVKVQPPISIVPSNRWGAKNGPRCALVMPLTGETCGRSKTHVPPCRTAEWMEQDKLARRAYKGAK